MLGKNGHSVESLRALIRLSPEQEADLCAFARSTPEEASNIRSVLEFRRKVGREFERLIAAQGKKRPARPRNDEHACSKPRNWF